MIDTDTNRPPARAQASAVDRFAALAVRLDVSLGVLLSTKARDFHVLLAAAAQAFSAHDEFSEREVNDLLRAFLAGAGSMLATDHVELRRWLVDFRLLERDGYGRVYRTGTPAGPIAAFVAELAGIDLAEAARVARLNDAARRAERKERWENAKRDADG
jgi:hypothetical protein